MTTLTLSDIPSRSGTAARREGDHHHDHDHQLLRHRLPAFEEDADLRAVLSRCELVAAEQAATAAQAATSAEAATAPAAAAAERVLESSKASPSPSTIDGPLEGLRRFSCDGVDGVFMGTAGRPLRYRL